MLCKPLEKGLHPKIMALTQGLTALLDHTCPTPFSAGSGGDLPASLPRPIAGDTASLRALLVPARSSLHRGGKPPQYSPGGRIEPLATSYSV